MRIRLLRPPPISVRLDRDYRVDVVWLGAADSGYVAAHFAGGHWKLTPNYAPRTALDSAGLVECARTCARARSRATGRRPLHTPPRVGIVLCCKTEMRTHGGARQRAPRPETPIQTARCQGSKVGKRR